jgi:hypothetical protein
MRTKQKRRDPDVVSTPVRAVIRSTLATLSVAALNLVMKSGFDDSALRATSFSVRRTLAVVRLLDDSTRFGHLKFSYDND